VSPSTPHRYFLSMLTGILLSTLTALASGVAHSENVLDLASFPRSKLTIESSQGSQAFDVWIADDEDRQRQGLMYVRDLPASQGMLFVNPQPRPSSFWMKNTYIPLDMLFIDARGKIIAIFADRKPLSLTPVGPSAPVLAILELRGGEAAARGIRKGDRVIHPAFR